MKAVQIPINRINQNLLSPNEMAPDQFNKLRENIRQTKQYPSLIVLEQDNDEGYILLDGHHRLNILKDLGYQDAWCEVWRLSRKQAKIVLATLNRLRGVDDTAKRAKLIKELFDEFEGDKDMLERLLPETERSLNSLLKIADREFDGVMSELEREDERGVLEDRFSQIVNPDEAKKLANIATAGEDFGNELELVFVFDDEKDYYKVANFFDGTDKTRKLIELVDGRSKSKSNK